MTQADIGGAFPGCGLRHRFQRPPSRCQVAEPYRVAARVYRKRIIELAAQYRLTAIYYFRYFASDGGLISYGPDEMDLFQRTAGYDRSYLKRCQSVRPSSPAARKV